MLRILAALDPYVGQTAPRGRDNPGRFRSLVLILRCTGLRIGDTVNLSSEKIEGNKLRLYTQKTGVHVCGVLPDFVVKTLETVPRINERFFFWAGSGNLEIAVSGWQKRIRKLVRIAGVKGHPHEFRDTLATELLQAGVPMERASCSSDINRSALPKNIMPPGPILVSVNSKVICSALGSGILSFFLKQKLRGSYAEKMTR
jgi:integrase